MGDQNDIAELTFTLLLMAGLLVVCVVAVVVFFRVWRKENKGRDQTSSSSRRGRATKRVSDRAGDCLPDRPCRR